MASGEQNLTQREIWDDSTLVESWGQALEEYKKYHSIQATGGNMEEAIKRMEAQQAAESAQVNGSDRAKTSTLTVDSSGRENDGGSKHADAMDVDQVKEAVLPSASSNQNEQQNSPVEVLNADVKVKVEEKEAVAEVGGQPEASSVSPEMVQNGIGQVADPELKTLLMAWYWAGYYTGLHEGRQQARK